MNEKKNPKSGRIKYNTPAEYALSDWNLKRSKTTKSLIRLVPINNPPHRKYFSRAWESEVEKENKIWVKTPRPIKTTIEDNSGLPSTKVEILPEKIKIKKNTTKPEINLIAKESFINLFWISGSSLYLGIKRIIPWSLPKSIIPVKSAIEVVRIVKTPNSEEPRKRARRK